MQSDILQNFSIFVLWLKICIEAVINLIFWYIFFSFHSKQPIIINRAIWYPPKLNINGNDVWSFTSSTPFIFFYGLTLYGKNPEVLVAVLLAPIVSFNTKKEEHFSKNLPWKVCVQRRLWRTRYTLTTVPFKNDSVISLMYLIRFYNKVVSVLHYRQESILVATKTL